MYILIRISSLLITLSTIVYYSLFPHINYIKDNSNLSTFKKNQSDAENDNKYFYNL